MNKESLEKWRICNIDSFLLLSIWLNGIENAGDNVRLSYSDTENGCVFTISQKH